MQGRSQPTTGRSRTGLPSKVSSPVVPDRNAYSFRDAAPRKALYGRLRILFCDGVTVFRYFLSAERAPEPPIEEALACPCNSMAWRSNWLESDRLARMVARLPHTSHRISAPQQ